GQRGPERERTTAALHHAPRQAEHDPEDAADEQRHEHEVHGAEVRVRQPSEREAHEQRQLHVAEAHPLRVDEGEEEEDPEVDGESGQPEADAVTRVQRDRCHDEQTIRSGMRYSRRSTTETATSADITTRYAMTTHHFVNSFVTNAHNNAFATAIAPCAAAGGSQRSGIVDTARTTTVRPNTAPRTATMATAAALMDDRR